MWTIGIMIGLVVVIYLVCGHLVAESYQPTKGIKGPRPIWLTFVITTGWLPLFIGDIVYNLFKAISEA